MSDQCCAVPLRELLLAIPVGERMQWQETDGLKAWHTAPVGRYAHEAVAAIDDLQSQLTRKSLDYVADVDRLQSQVDALRADAERWRYHYGNGFSYFFSGNGDDYCIPDSVVEQTDIAIVVASTDFMKPHHPIGGLVSMGKRLSCHCGRDLKAPIHFPNATWEKS